MYIILGNFWKKLNRESSAIRQAYRAELGWNKPVTSVSGLFRNLCGRECVWVGFQQVYYLLWDGNKRSCTAWQFLFGERTSVAVLSPSGKRFKFWRLASLLIEKDIEKDFLTGNSITHDEHRLDRALCLFEKHVTGYIKIVFIFFKVMVTINISYKSPSNKILEIKTILRNLSKNSMNKILKRLFSKRSIVSMILWRLNATIHGSSYFIAKVC